MLTYVSQKQQSLYNFHFWYIHNTVQYSRKGPGLIQKRLYHIFNGIRMNMVFTTLNMRPWLYSVFNVVVLIHFLWCFYLSIMCASRYPRLLRIGSVFTLNRKSSSFLELLLSESLTIFLYFFREGVDSIVPLLFLYNYCTTLVLLGISWKRYLNYLCALGIDRYSPLNECSIQVPFIWNQLYLAHVPASVWLLYVRDVQLPFLMLSAK